MRLALEQERKGRELLLGELAKTRESGQQQALLSEREQQVQTSSRTSSAALRASRTAAA